VILRVRDTGTGMTPEVQAKAFEPFFTTKPPGTGSGLGLSQVYGTARQSGGDVTIDSAVGHGTTVSVYLPRAAQPAERDAAGAGAAVARISADAVILVVDDDEAVRGTIGDMLANLGYGVRPVGMRRRRWRCCERAPPSIYC
jgi:hypothetical protein